MRYKRIKLSPLLEQYSPVSSAQLPYCLVLKNILKNEAKLIAAQKYLSKKLF